MVVLGGLLEMPVAVRGGEGVHPRQVAALDEEMPEPEPFVVDALQHRELRTLDVEREEVDDLGCVGVEQQSWRRTPAAASRRLVRPGREAADHAHASSR